MQVHGISVADVAEHNNLIRLSIRKTRSFSLAASLLHALALELQVFGVMRGLGQLSS